MADDHSMFHFRLTSIDVEIDCASVPRLFHRTADAIDDLGEVYVYDILLEDVSTITGPVPSIAVFYSRIKLPIRKHVVRLHDEILCTGDEDKVDGEHTFVVDQDERHRIAHDVGPSICLCNSYYETDISNVPKLLRRSADYVELLGGVHVDDIMLEIDEHFKASVPYLTICYHRPASSEIQQRLKNTRVAYHSEIREQTIHQLAIKDAKDEPGYLSRPRLLRETADTIDRLGVVDIHGLVLHEEHTDCKWVPEHVSFVNVYYRRLEVCRDRERRKHHETATDVLAQLAARHRYVGADIDPNMLRDGDNHSFRLHNPPAEPGLCSVSKLLRRTADAVDAMKKVEIDELVLHTEVTALGRLPVVAVYYSRPTRADKDNRREWVFIARDAKRRAKMMKKRRKRTKKRERRV